MASASIQDGGTLDGLAPSPMFISSCVYFPANGPTLFFVVGKVLFSHSSIGGHLVSPVTPVDSAAVDLAMHVSVTLAWILSTHRRVCPSHLMVTP